MRVLLPLTALVSTCAGLVSGQRQSVFSKDDNVCRTKECYDASAHILKTMNPNVDPCDNFHEYACGGFLANTKIPPTKSMLDSGLLQENIDSTIRKVLQSGPQGPSGKLTGAASRILQKAQGFYKSCMNETDIAEIGHTPLYKELQDLFTTVFPVQHGSLISLFPDAAPPSAELLNATNRERLTSAMAHLYRSSALTILSFWVNPDERNPEVQQLWVLRDNPAIPDRVFLEEAPILAKYRKAIEETYTLVFGQSEGGAKFASDVIALETMIANFSRAAAGGDAATTSQHVSPTDLNKLYPSLNWPVLLQKMLHGTNVTHDDNRALHSLTPSHLEGLDKLFRETPAATLQKYFAWMMIFSRRSLLPIEYREPIDRILRELEGVVNHDITPDRWQTCVDSTSANLASIIGHFYVAQMFSAATKDQVQTIVSGIRDAYRSDFQELSWLDKTTRANAITKLDAMLELIGYSTMDPNVGSAKDLDAYYAAVKITTESGGDYYDNMIQAKAHVIRTMLTQLGQPPNRDQMGMDPQYVNAYYNPLLNHFAVLAGIVQPPKFTPNAPEYLNFAALGMVAGHEIGHGFDNSGRRYDATGKLFDWWTNATATEFESRTKCFIDQYANFTVTGPDGKILHTNGLQTLGENIADNGGSRISFMAWAKRFTTDRLSQKYNNKLLPGVRLSHLSREQLFFISFGQSWCRLRTPTFLANQIRDDEHSPSHARVNGVMQNSREFARAFRCRRNSFMNPVNKCEIW
ncbi:hypothetical protein CPC16_008446 [Podila verticillata]|nr:hypothetical protein CPC16_008446 [Podila verticillata]